MAKCSLSWSIQVAHPTNWYPAATGSPLDEPLRIAFDNLYALRDSMAAQQAAAPSLTLAQIQQGLQNGGPAPLNLTGLPGGVGVTTVNGLSGKVVIVSAQGINVQVRGDMIYVSLTNSGPGAGTYTTGAKLTGGGSNGTITIDATGRITAIHQAS